MSNYTYHSLKDFLSENVIKGIQDVTIEDLNLFVNKGKVNIFHYGIIHTENLKKAETVQQTKFLLDNMNKMRYVNIKPEVLIFYIENKSTEQLKLLLDSCYFDLNSYTRIKIDGYDCDKIPIKCAMNMPEKLELLVKAGADINKKLYSDKKTLLMYVETVKETEFLVKLGADVDAKDKLGYTPLMYAKTAKQTKFLIEAGADVNTINKDGKTPLMCVNTTLQAKLLLDAGADVNAYSYYYGSILHFYHDIERIKLFVEYGANINKKNKDGEIPLVLSKNIKDFEKVKFFIETGADVNASNKDGFTAISYYIENIERTKYLIEKGANVNVRSYNDGNFIFIYSIKKKNFKLTKLLLEVNDVNVNVKDNEGRTAFFLCVLSSNCDEIFEISKLLLDSGANVNDIDKYGKTALMYAQTVEQTRFLIENGADVNIKDNYGETPLMFTRSIEQTELLIGAGANVNEKNGNGVTPLMYAKSIAEAKLLLEAGADVNARDNYGRTALVYAKTIEETNFLLEAGADIHNIDDSGNTVIMCNGPDISVDKLLLLLKCGVNVNIKNKKGKTVYDMCGYDLGKNMYGFSHEQTSVLKKARD